MSNDVHIVTYALGDPGADDKKLWLLKAPSDAQGGGIRIVEAYVVNQIAVTNSLGVGGTTFTLALHKYSSGGTPAVNGTIAAAVGGTAEGWAAGVDRKSTRLNSSHLKLSRMPSSA